MPEGYEDPRDGQQIIREVHHYHEGGNSKSFDKLKDGLLYVAIVAFGGIVWSMSNTVAKLETTVNYLAETVRVLQDKK